MEQINQNNNECSDQYSDESVGHLRINIKNMPIGNNRTGDAKKYSGLITEEDFNRCTSLPLHTNSENRDEKSWVSKKIMADKRFDDKCERNYKRRENGYT